MQRPVNDARRSYLQDLLLAIAPYTIYTFSPLPAGAFLWNSSSNQFAFALLPASAQKYTGWRLLAAVYELQVFLMWMAVGHFGVFHCATFLRVIQRELINQAANLE